MNGKVPNTILTDQCAAMAAAIKDVLPDTRHRWCRWHVLKNAKENLGGIYSQFSGFKAEFHSLLTDVLDEGMFEAGWADILRKYGLVRNEYLGKMYGTRMMWAKPYFRDTFCAGMTSTQRSESANHLLKTFIPRSAPMHLFVSQYQAMLKARDADEQREEHVTRQKKRLITVGAPIEWHAARVYTRVMFNKFSGELYASGRLATFELQDCSGYVVKAVMQTSDSSATPCREAIREWELVEV
ncbi:unnamed protein product [Urochloa humidicola]